MMQTELKNGEILNIKTQLPPLGDYAPHVGCWSDIRDELLSGQLQEWLYTPYFIGEINGDIAGSMSYFAAADQPEVGAVEFVGTAEPHRRKGIASALMSALIGHFRVRGGQALYLCTTNPHAGSLYEKHGFHYKIGDGMRCLTPGIADFDATYLSFCGTAQVRPATWSDLAPLTVLYNHPEPHWHIKEYLTQCFHDTRFESHFIRLMRRIEEQKGAFLVLENPQQRLAGAAVLERLDTFYEQHVASLSLRVCPTYFSQAAQLIEAAVHEASLLGITILQTFIAAGDQDHIDIVRSTGFAEEARLPKRLRDGNQEKDLLIYSRHNNANTPLPRIRGDYYGNRKTWQEDRASN